jgi:mono/diheme cytochrome c family protein
MKNFLLGILFTLAAIFLGAFFYLRLGLAEVRGDLPPSRFETWLLQPAIHASVRREAPALPNPIPPTDENLIAGGRMYHDECSGCHGAPGKPDQSSDTLFPPIPQLAATGTQYSESQIFWIAKHGIRRTGMFANGKWDADQKLWTISAYIARIKSLPPQVQAALEEKSKPAATK